MEETWKCCAFSGHRKIKSHLLPLLEKQLTKEILRCAERGVCRFICGGAEGFDFLAAKQVLFCKMAHPEIYLEIALPHPGFSSHYGEVLRQADRVTLLSSQYYPGCYHARNRYMAEQSQYLIYYLTAGKGGTYYTVRYAQKLGKCLIPLLSSCESE